MTTELKQAAQQAVDAFDAFGDADDFASLFELTRKMRELRTAIQQAEAQQPATGEPVAWSEREQLRHAQAAVVMPMIGPLLDAWENSDREVMSQEPELSKQLKNINSAMEDADTHPAPSAPDAAIDSAIYNQCPDFDDWHEGPSIDDIRAIVRAAMSNTTEPVKVAPYNPTEEMRWAMKRIDPALSSEQCRALWSAAWSVAPSTHPAPSAPKDDQIAALVNKVRDIARMFHDHQSLRERIAIELVPALKVSQEAKSDAERGRFLIEWLKRYGLLQAEFGQMGVGEKPENWWLLHAPWGIDQTRPFFGHGKTPEQAIDAAKDAT